MLQIDSFLPLKAPCLVHSEFVFVCVWSSLVNGYGWSWISNDCCQVWVYFIFWQCSKCVPMILQTHSALNICRYCQQYRTMSLVLWPVWPSIMEKNHTIIPLFVFLFKNYSCKVYLMSLQCMYKFIVTVEWLRERTEYIDIFLFSARHSIMFCFQCSVYWWKGSVRFACFKILLVKLS